MRAACWWRLTGSMLPRTHGGRALLAAITVPLLIAAGLTRHHRHGLDQRPPAGESASSRSEARTALADARAALARPRTRHRWPSSRDATMTLLRLAQLRSALGPGADRGRRRPAPGRPSAPRPGGLHRQPTATTGTPRAATPCPSADNDADGTPDYVEAVTVHGRRRAQHLRRRRATAPRSRTAPSAATAQTDIYLTDIGSEGLYGYCTSDQPIPSTRPGLRRLGLLRPRQRLHVARSSRRTPRSRTSR